MITKPFFVYFKTRLLLVLLIIIYYNRSTCVDKQHQKDTKYK